MRHKDKVKRAAYQAAYKAANKEKIAAYQAAYDAANKEKIAAYRAANKEAIATQRAAYQVANKEKIAAKQAAYKAANKEKIASYQAAYKAANKEAIATQRAAYKRNRRQTDPAFKFIKNLRKRQSHVLKGRSSTTAGLGCTRQELCDYLAGKFQPGMAFDNHGVGGWHIDHIIPLSSYEKDSEGNWDSESQYNKQLIHYTNLQPLWEKDNLEKSNKILA